MIYICCIKYAKGGEICVLAVGDDELDVGDDVAASSEVAEGRTRAGRLGELTQMDQVSVGNRPLNFEAGERWIMPGYRGPQERLSINRRTS